MLLAHGVGAVVRGIGRSARDLDPAHRRDGIGLAAIGAAIVVAGTTWWHMDNAVGRLMTAVVRGAFGALAWMVPLLLALLGWRFLRHPDRNTETGRMVIGWLALIIGVIGLVHIANGTPRPAGGALAMRDAGGLIGFVASAPLVAALTPCGGRGAARARRRVRRAGDHGDATAHRPRRPGSGPRPPHRRRRDRGGRGQDRGSRTATGPSPRSRPPRPPPAGHRGRRS